MAQSRRKKKTLWLKRLLLFVFVPFFIWFVAFLVWFNWSSVERLFTRSSEHDRAPVKAPRGRDAEQGEKASGRSRDESRPSESRPKEKILDEDRKSLEEILKRQR